MTLTAEVNTVHGDDRTLKMLDDARQATEVFNEHYDEWIEEYPDQWVALNKDGLVEVGPDIEEVVKAIRSRGYKRRELKFEYLNSQPGFMLL